MFSRAVKQVNLLQPEFVVCVGDLIEGYTENRERLARDRDRPTDVPVFVNVEDFVSHKTAVFGMTRLGKSNTNKVIACSTFQHAQERGEQTHHAEPGPQFDARHEVEKADDENEQDGLAELVL